MAVIFHCPDLGPWRVAGFNGNLTPKLTCWFSVLASLKARGFYMLLLQNTVSAWTESWGQAPLSLGATFVAGCWKGLFPSQRRRRSSGLCHAAGAEVWRWTSLGFPQDLTRQWLLDAGFGGSHHWKGRSFHTVSCKNSRDKRGPSIMGRMRWHGSVAAWPVN